MAASQVHSAVTERFALTCSLCDCPLYPVYTCCFKTILLFSITCTAILCVEQCTTSGLPHESRHMFRALKNLARGQARLCCCDFIFCALRHTPTTINRRRERSSTLIFALNRQLVGGGVGELISARSSLNKSSCYIFSRKRPSLIPSALIVPRFFCLNETTTMSSLDIRRCFTPY